MLHSLWRREKLVLGDWNDLEKERKARLNLEEEFEGLMNARCPDRGSASQ